MNTSNYKQKNKLLPWSEKYRPVAIDDIIYHEKITKTIVNYLELGKLPHLLFYGPPGTGKTSTIIAIAKHYYKEDFYNMTLVLNASEERGIETVRTGIKQFVTTSGLPENKNTPPFKLIILDEIDAMTDDAQAILRKVIEKYVSNVRFCFICNYLKKINPAIQSRCVIFRFKPIPQININSFILDICAIENIHIDNNAVELIIKRSNGDMRKLLNILQSISMYINNSTLDELDSKKTIIDENYVSKILSCPTNKIINQMLIFIQNNNLSKSYEYVNNIIDFYGISLAELIACFYEFFMNSIINDDKSVIKYDNDKIVNIIKNMSMINENLSFCNNDTYQITAFVSLFYL